MGPSLPDLLAIAPITRLEVLGTVSPAARDAVAALGAVRFGRLQHSVVGHLDADEAIVRTRHSRVSIAPEGRR